MDTTQKLRIIKGKRPVTILGTHEASNGFSYYECLIPYTSEELRTRRNSTAWGHVQMVRKVNLEPVPKQVVGLYP